MALNFASRFTLAMCLKFQEAAWWCSSRGDVSLDLVASVGILLYTSTMVVRLPKTLEEWLKRYAEHSGRDVPSVLEDAVRKYLEAAAATDVSAEDIAETQARLAPELGMR